jgi:hypothetical protein
VPRHERFEELCAAASIGQASGAELAELQEHLAWCAACQNSYSEFLGLNAAQYAQNAGSLDLSTDFALNAIDSTLLRERFLKKAATEGISFTTDGADRRMVEPQVTSHRSRNWPLRIALVGALIGLVFAIGAGGYYLGAPHLAGPDARSAISPAIAAHEPAGAAIAALGAENRDLASEVAALRVFQSSQSSKLSELELSSFASKQERVVLLARAKDQEERITDLESRLDQAQAALANVRAGYEEAKASLSNNHVVLVEDQVKIRDLSTQLTETSSALNRERDLLAAGRDFRELMSARNLHIVDVFDTDPRGKNRAAFGRIFFTEGKSLLFYAYDMPDARLKDAGYQYRIWGKKEGPNEHARNLGIFFADDRSQKRWVFQYDDSRVLDEIDSVFVTLEPPSINPMQPRGDKLMYAYLRGQANHP